MKRVLIITYYWPPAGGPGVQRWLHFVKYFIEFGITPVVYIPKNPHYPLVDNSFLNQVPTDIEIISLPINEPYKFAKFFSKGKTKTISSGIIKKNNASFLEKLMLFVRGNFFIPDARVGWVKPSVAFLSDYIKSNDIDFIVTTGPPHSLHLIALKLQEYHKIGWLADFRDPWTTIHYHKLLRLTNASKRKHKLLEKQVLDAASKIAVTSPTTKKEFQKITSTPITVVTNGFEITEQKEVKLDESFSIAHIGSLLSGRNPEILWQVLAEICAEDSSFKCDLTLKLIGAISNEVQQSLKKYNLESNLEIKGYVPHSEAILFQKSAQILLLVEINSEETRAIIPGKLFEYLAAKRPIIAFGPNGSDIKLILEETNSGIFFDYTNKVELKKLLQKHYRDFKLNTLSIHSHNIEKYSRRELTRKMAYIILNPNL